MTIPTIAGVQARIHRLEDRPPFMLAADLAAFYEVTPRRVHEQVGRNPDRFPDDFCFRLTEAETAHLKSQNETSNGGGALSAKVNRAAPLAFTRRGAYALSGVLKSGVADAVSVALIRAFDMLSEGETDFARRALAKHREWILARRPRLVRVRAFAQLGWSFDDIRRAARCTRRETAEALAELTAMEVLDALPEGARTELARHG